MEHGNFNNTKYVNKGVYEFKIYSGPGYRIYFSQDEALIVLLGGGTKKTQSADIAQAQKYWYDYQQRKKERK